MREPLSLADGLDRFVYEFMPSRALSRKTREEYGRDISDLIDFLYSAGIGNWHKVDLALLNRYMTWLERRHLKASTRCRRVYAIKSIFSYLRQIGVVEKDHSKKLIPPPLPIREPRFLTANEYSHLLAAVDSPRATAIIQLFLQTGIGLSELVYLNIQDVTMPETISPNPDDAGVLRLNRRCGENDALPLNWKALSALETWLEHREQLFKQKGWKTDALFVSKFGTRLSQRAIQLMITKFLDRAGIKRASVHTLRHTMAIHYLAKGGDIGAVQRLLGHAEVETTQLLYEEPAKRMQRRMVQELAL